MVYTLKFVTKALLDVTEDKVETQVAGITTTNPSYQDSF